jgi:hypothetical protein
MSRLISILYFLNVSKSQNIFRVADDSNEAIFGFESCGQIDGTSCLTFEDCDEDKEGCGFAAWVRILSVIFLVNTPYFLGKVSCEK